ncbi:MAG TPA: hypothetical protein PLT65_00905 [Bacilli bacterium]|nr:hypothetical protein [Bacilli bacterium]
MDKKKNLLAIIMIIILTILSITIIFSMIIDKGVKNYKNDNFKLSYDKNWSIESKGDTSLKLVHKSKSLFQVDIIVLDEKYKRSELSTLIDDVLNEIEKDNPNYSLINKTETTICKKGYDAYQYLYETDKEQAMISIGKSNDMIFILTYVADYSCFDILLDSVKEIIWSFQII